ncbi:hypothetical protein M8J77_021460 [Diaphorina citri]|nr:hypothetical protein M8J77_021460 [Diaphorina citri]
MMRCTYPEPLSVFFWRRLCKDPSELKTWTSALVCPQCNEATVISTNPLDGDAAWTCRKSSCDFYLSAESVHKLLNK